MHLSPVLLLWHSCGVVGGACWRRPQIHSLNEGAGVRIDVLGYTSVGETMTVAAPVG